MDVVVLGSANIDFICYVDRLPKPGETLHGHKFENGFGGKGANQAVAAARLGAKTGMVAKLGDDLWGNRYLENLQKEGIDVQFVDICSTETTGIAQITVSNNGENQIVIVAGANNLLSSNDVNKAEDYIQNSQVLICQLETPVEATIHALRKFRGTSILNAAPAMLNIPQELLTLSSIFCVNETEAELITGLKLTSVTDSKPILSKLIAMGANIVVITMGALGAVYISKNDVEKMVHVPAANIEKVIDTTGAGDAFIGAFAYYLSKYAQVPFHQQIGAACKVASFSVQHRGSQMSFPTIDQISNFEKEFVWRYI